MAIEQWGKFGGLPKEWSNPKVDMGWNPRFNHPCGPWFYGVCMYICIYFSCPAHCRPLEHSSTLRRGNKLMQISFHGCPLTYLLTYLFFLVFTYLFTIEWTGRALFTSQSLRFSKVFGSMIWSQSGNADLISSVGVLRTQAGQVIGIPSAALGYYDTTKDQGYWKGQPTIGDKTRMDI